MGTVLLLTKALQPSAEVLPGLSFPGPVPRVPSVAGPGFAPHRRQET